MSKEKPQVFCLKPPNLNENPNAAPYNEIKNEEMVTKAIVESNIKPKFIDNKINYTSVGFYPRKNRNLVVQEKSLKSFTKYEEDRARFKEYTSRIN